MKFEKQMRLFLFIFVAVLGFGGVSIVWHTIKNGISPMPSSRKAKHAILKLIAEIDDREIYELGSGWGSLLIPIAKAHPNSLVIGYETSPIPYLVSRLFAHLLNVKNIHVKKKDFLECSLERADLVICYLYPGAMKKLKDKFERELKPGTIVISNTFAISGWKASRIIYLDDLYKTKIYLYEYQGAGN